MAIEYEIHKYRTVETTDDRATFSWCELTSTHSPSIAGKLLSVAIECRANDGEAFTMTPCHLGVWETAENGELIRVGVSSNKATQVVETSVVWEFDETYLNGRTLVLGILDNPNGNLADTIDYGLGARVKNNDTDGCYTYHKTIGKKSCIPDITFIIEEAIEVPDEPDEPTPDDEPELRQIRIEEYLPPIVKNTAEFDQIAAAENPEFNKLAECIYFVLKDSFIKSATDYGVSRWEKMLGISPASTATLEDRKAAVITHLNTNLPYTVPVLRQMLIGLLGEGNFTMNINNDTATLTIAVSLDTTEAQIAEVKSLLDRVLPCNLVTKMEWADGLPMSYERLQYIESNGSQRIDTGRLWNAHDEISILYEPTRSPNYNIFGAGKYRMAATGKGEGVYFELPVKHSFPAVLGMVKTNAYYSFNELRVNEYSKAIEIADFESTNNIIVCANNTANGHPPYPANMRLYSYEHKKANDDNMRLVPALSPTGQPGMFDTVARVFKTNIGSGDFTYPGKANEATTYSLRNRIYAQYTEHGIRRLYRVPEGYNGTPEEYAEEHGFKILVETPMPEEGCWTPVWHEREDCIELEWVETEPPTEEVIENE